MKFIKANAAEKRAKVFQLGSGREKFKARTNASVKKAREKIAGSC